MLELASHALKKHNAYAALGNWRSDFNGDDSNFWSNETFMSQLCLF